MGTGELSGQVLSEQGQASAVRVRDARASDAADIARLCTQLGYPNNTADVMPARLAKVQADANARVLVAELADRVVGLLTIHLRDTLNHATPIAQLTLLVVDETERTAGVGRTLVRAAEAWAVQWGSRRIAVTTHLSRAGAHAFYERVGYTHTGRRYGKDFPSHTD